MGARVYVLLQVADGKSDDVAQALRRRRGVLMADALENPRDVMMVVEARGQQKLAELTVQAIAAVETLTQDVHLLPTKYGCDTGAPQDSGLQKRNRNVTRTASKSAGVRL